MKMTLIVTMSLTMTLTSFLQEGSRVRAAKSVYSAPLSQIGSSNNLHKGVFVFVFNFVFVFV